MICTSEGRKIESVHISNVTNLTIVPLVHGLQQSAPEMIFENIQNMESILSRTFLQIKRYPFSKFGCATPVKDLESIVFRNVHIDSIEREAFHNLTNMKNFTMENVTVNKMHAAAIQVFMMKNSEMRIIRNNFGVMEYLSIFVRGDKLFFAHNSVTEMYSNALNATVYDFSFVNNSVGWMHCAALAVLAQNVKILDSSYNYLASGSFQAVGPGLPENSLRGFGRLKFTYEFNNNLIESLEVGSLHPDWQAYKNVGSVIKVTYNAIKCTCAELAWLGSKEGFGRDFSLLERFHETVLKVENNNICSDAPCILPIEAVRLMVVRNGRCLHNITQEYMCKQYYTTSPMPEPPVTKRSTFRFNNTSIPVLRYQKLTIHKSNASHLESEIKLLAFIISMIYLIC